MSLSSDASTGRETCVLAFLIRKTTELEWVDR
jgi:hypothetical protein